MTMIRNDSGRESEPALSVIFKSFDEFEQLYQVAIEIHPEVHQRLRKPRRDAAACHVLLHELLMLSRDGAAESGT